jgi:hypothetical protein
MALTSRNVERRDPGSTLASNAWFREGDLWLVHSVADHKTLRFRSVAGFALLHQLLEKPGQEVHAIDLVGAQEISTALPLADRQTLEQFRRRLAEIDEERDEAEAFHDPSRVDALLRDREELLASLRSMVGMGGKARTSGSDSERARVRVTRAIRAAIDRLQPDLPLLADHLTNRVRTGTYCAYLDDALSPVSWNLDGVDFPATFLPQLPIPHRSEQTRSRHGHTTPARLLPELLDQEESLPWLGMDRFLGDITEFEKPFVGVLVAAGGAGSGKSRLLREVGRRQAAAGSLVLIGANDERFRSPFQPFERALTELVDRSGGDIAVLGQRPARLAPLLPHLANQVPPDPHDDGNPKPIQAIEAVVSWFADHVAQGPVFLIVEDLHHATVDTINLLTALLRRCRVGCAISYNPALVGPSHPIHRLLAELVIGTTLVRSIELPPFTEGEIAQVAARLLPANLGPRSSIAQWVFAQASGNPILSIELLRTLTSLDTEAIARHLRQRDDRLAAVDPISDMGHSRLRQIVRGRFAAGSDEATIRLLRQAAVLGSEFDPHTLAAISQSAPDDVLARLGDAVESGLVVVHRRMPMRFRFAHNVERQVLYDDLSELDRMLLHHRAGTHLVNALRPDEPDRAAHLAYHFGCAGGPDAAMDAIQFAIQAGDDAVDRLGFGDAAGWYSQAENLVTQAVEDGRPTLVDHTGLALKRGRAEWQSGLPIGRKTLLRAAKAAIREGRLREATDAALEANRGFFSQAMKADAEWIETVHHALTAATEPTDRAELLSIVSSEMLWAHNANERFALSNEALAIARSLGDPTTLARVLFRRDHTVATLETISQRVTEASEHFDAALEVDDELILLQAMQTCASALLASGEVESSIVFGNEMMARAERFGLPAWQFNAVIGHAGAQLHRGQLDLTMAAVARMFSLGVQCGRGADAATFAADIAVNVARWKDELEPMVAPMSAIVANPTMNRQTAYLVGPRLYDAGYHDEARRVLEVAHGQGLQTLPKTFMEFPTLTNLAYLSVRLHDDRFARYLHDRLMLVTDGFPCTTTTGPCGMHSLGMLSGLMGKSDAAEHQLRQATEYHDRSLAPLFALESRIELACVLLDRVSRTEADRHEGTTLCTFVAQQADKLKARFLVRRSQEVLQQYDRTA